MTYPTLRSTLLAALMFTACASAPAPSTNTAAGEPLLGSVPDLEVQDVETDEANDTRRVLTVAVDGPRPLWALFFLRDDAGQWQLRGRTPLESQHPAAPHLLRFLDSEEDEIVAILHTMLRLNRNLGRIDASEVVRTQIDGDDARIDVSFADAPTLGDDPMTSTGDAQRIDGVWQGMGATYPVPRSVHEHPME
ncbi:MAG: hypothetical protein AB8I08_03955 [Sandaracinaceae bacterium]